MFELSRVKLYIENDLKGNENCFELAGGSSYWGSSCWEPNVLSKVHKSISTSV